MDMVFVKALIDMKVLYELPSPDSGQRNLLAISWKNLAGSCSHLEPCTLKYFKLQMRGCVSTLLHPHVHPVVAATLGTCRLAYDVHPAPDTAHARNISDGIRTVEASQPLALSLPRTYLA